MESPCTELQNALAELGDSPDAIARLLEAKKLQGVRNTVRFLNPVIRLLRCLVRIHYVDMDLIQSGALRVTMPDGARIHLPLPQALSDFLQLFNQGAYPALEMSLDKAEGILREQERRSERAKPVG